MPLVKVSIPGTPLKNLTYEVPENFPEIESGMRVVVPLGPRFRTGFVVETDCPLEGEIKTRPVADLIDELNLFSPPLLRLTKWMAEYYLADWGDILKAALPPGLDVQPKTLIAATDQGKAKPHHPILQILAEKEILPLQELYRLFGQKGTYSQIRNLEKEGGLEIRAASKSPRKTYNTIEIVPGSEPPSKPKEMEIYEFLQSRKGPVALEQVRSQFPRSSATIRKLARSGKVRCFWLPLDPGVSLPVSSASIRLTPEQHEAIEQTRRKMDAFQVFLLHGVTGSGKTEVYLRLAQQVLKQGKSVLFLVPEIALLPLIAVRSERFLKLSPTLLHSELGERHRLEEWQKVRRGQSHMVIGTRSAVFAPLKNLGLIVVDEEHDGSYKQGEYPRYNGRDCAIMRAQFEKCPILLGSATPSIESYYNSGNGKYQYLALPLRIENRKMPKIQLVDMKEEYRETGDPVFSRILLDEIRQRLKGKEQVLILQNRRGYASWLMCRECGHIMECPKCSVTLTYHKSPSRMICHYCDYSRLVPRECENCESRYLHLYGVGTEKVAEILRNRFPSARLERLDRDSTRKRGSIAAILSRFGRKETDILVGTQMLAKGHDFPGITLVGIVGADSAIGIPDFRASERLFQLITQVSGRSGRGKNPGRVILQTFYPDHYAIQSSIHQNYQVFYDKEIRFRRFMMFPPYMMLASITFAGKDGKKTLEEARKFAKLILAFKKDDMKLIGPAIAPLSKLSGKYRFQLLLKSPSRASLHLCLEEATGHYQAGTSRHSTFSIDVDPYSLA